MKMSLKSLLKSAGVVLSVTAIATCTAVAASAAIPKKYSSVSKGYITPVKDQGNHGTCWSFAANAASEASLIREHPELYNKKNMDLSENMLAYFFFYPNEYGHVGLTPDVFNYYGGSDYLEFGGNLWFSGDRFMNWCGPYAENSKYPYDLEDVPSIYYKSWTEDEYLKTLNSSVAHLTDYNVITSVETDYMNKVKQLIMDYGAVGASYYHYEYNQPYLTDDEKYYYYPVASNGNHAITVVGWDDTISASNFYGNPPGDGAWLIKNSWGTEHLDNGYMWISYYDQTINCFTAFDYAVKGDKDYYDNIYSYDLTCWNAFSDYSDSMSAVNVFTSDKAQSLEAVSVYTMQADDDLKVSVFLNLSDISKVDTAKPVATASMHADEWGYHTIKLSKPVTLKKGDKFYIKVDYSNTDFAYVPLEAGGYWGYDCYFGPEAGEGLSYLKYYGSWLDLVDQGVGNVGIKAYTKKIVPGLSGVSDFKVTARTTDSIKLSWKKNSSATGYIIEQYKNDKWVRIAKIENNATTSYKVTKLADATRYAFRIQTYKGAQKSKFTDKLVTYTNPKKVSGFKVTAKTGSSVTLKWNRNPNATGYIIERYKDNKWVRVVKLEKNTTTSYTAKKLAGSTRYAYRITAYKNTDNGAVKGAYTDKLVTYTKPSNMSSFKASAKTDSTITLSWKKNTSATGYIVEQYKNNKWVRIKKFEKNSYTSFKLTGLKPSTRYAFRIQAYKEYGSGALKSEYTNKLVVYTNPKKVSNFKAVAKTSSTITLNWSKNTSASGYIIQRYDGTKWIRVKKIENASITTFKLTGLKANTRYAFRIQAYKDTPNGGAVKSAYTDKVVVYTAKK